MGNAFCTVDNLGFPHFNAIDPMRYKLLPAISNSLLEIITCGPTKLDFKFITGMQLADSHKKTT